MGGGGGGGGGEGGGRHATCTVLIDEFVFPRNVKAPKQETKPTNLCHEGVGVFGLSHGPVHRVLRRHILSAEK